MNIRKTITTTDYPTDVPNELQNLIPGFLERRLNETVELDNLLQKMDYLNIEKIGHKMKGHGLSYGFEAMSILGSELEIAARTSSIDKIKPVLENYKDLVDELLEMFSN